LLRTGDVEGAVANFRKATELNPDLTVAYRNLAVGLLRQEKLAELQDAIRRWQAGVRKDNEPGGPIFLPRTTFNLSDGAFLRDSAACLIRNDVPTLDPKERARLRGQALAWLRDALTIWQKTFANEPDEKGASVMLMTRRYPREIFNKVGDVLALASLPESERQDWQRLLDDIANAVRRAQDACGFVRSWPGSVRTTFRTKVATASKHYTSSKYRVNLYLVLAQATASRLEAGT
jgi:hypothetical protein